MAAATSVLGVWPRGSMHDTGTTQGRGEAGLAAMTAKGRERAEPSGGWRPAMCGGALVKGWLLKGRCVRGVPVTQQLDEGPR